MLQKNTRRDFPFWLLGSFAKGLPSEERVWADAMLGELTVIRGAWDRLLWTLSGICGLSKIWLRIHRRKLPEGFGSRAIMLIAFYHAAFSCVIVIAIIWELPIITATWREAFFPLLIAFFVALIPGVIAVGLWMFDEAARLMAIFFSFLHGFGNCVWISSQNLGWKALPIGRIALDLLMIGVLLLPSITRIFRPQRIELRLRS